MSNNLKAIALTDEAIAKLAEVRDELQKRHDETVAAVKAVEVAKASVVSRQIINALAATRDNFAAIILSLFRR